MLVPRRCDIELCKGKHAGRGLCERHYKRLLRALNANPGADKARLLARWQREEIADAAERNDHDLLSHFIDKLRDEAREPLARVGTPAELPDDRGTLEACRRMNVALEMPPDAWIATPYPGHPEEAVEEQDRARKREAGDDG